MKRKTITLLSCTFFLLALVPVQAQMGYPYPYPGARRSPNSRTGGATAPMQGIAATFHGTVKQLSKKELVITNSEDQDVVIRVSRKTKYWKEGKEIKASNIEEGMLVSVEAGEDVDAKPIASGVTVETLNKEKPAAKTSDTK